MNLSSDATGPDYGTGEKTLGIYVLGFALCIILTLIPFGAVMHPELTAIPTLTIIYVSAILQFLVQVICFLRLNYSSKQARMNTLSFILSIFILFVIVAGSLWIMWNLNYRMMH